MRILVAGGTGFLGRALLSALAEPDGTVDGAGQSDGSALEVLVLSRNGAAAEAQLPGGAKINHIAGQWAGASRDDRILEFAPQVVVNLVGDSHPRSSIGREVEEIGGQVLPFLELITALEPKGLDRVVFSSSAGAIYRSGRDAVAKDRADTAYHSTKRSVEHYLSSRCIATGLSAVSLRISNPVGDLDRPGFGIVGQFARAVARGEEVDFIGDYATPKDYVVLADVAAAIAAAALSPWPEPGHAIVDVGSGWAIDAPGMYKVIRSLAEDGFDPGRSPLDHGFGPSSLDHTPLADALGWRPRGDLIATIDGLVRRQHPEPNGANG